MSLIGDFKEVADLVKKAGDLDLYRRIVDLQGEVVELSSRSLELEKQNRELREALDLKQRMVFKEPFYFQEGDEVPFCARCWEPERIAVHLRRDRDDWLYRCNKCGTCYDPPGERPPRSPISHRRR